MDSKLCHGESLQQTIGLLPSARFCHGQTNIGIEPIFWTAEVESSRGRDITRRVRISSIQPLDLPGFGASNIAHKRPPPLAHGARQASACPIQRLDFSNACPIQGPRHSTYQEKVSTRTLPVFHSEPLAYACPFWAPRTSFRFPPKKLAQTFHMPVQFGDRGTREICTQSHYPSFIMHSW